MCVGCRSTHAGSTVSATLKRIAAGSFWIKARILFALVVLALSPSCASAASDRDVVRINHGLNFKFVDEFVRISGHWSHSYVIPIPKDTFESTHQDVILAHKRGDKVKSWLDRCLSRIYHESEGRPDLNVGNLANHDLTSSVSLCGMYESVIHQVVRMVKEDHALIKQQLRSIADLLPPDLNLRNPSPKKPRGLLDFVGEISSSLFGIATDRHVAQIEKTVKHLVDASNLQTSVFKKTASDLASFSKLTSDRFDGLVKVINQSALNALETWNHFVDDLHGEENFRFDLIRKAVSLNHAMSKLSVYQASFLDSVEMLVDGKLPSFLITASMLNETMREITQALETLPYHLVHKNPNYYFTRVRVSVGVFNSSLIVNVPFALTQFTIPSRCYEIEKISQPVPGKKGAKLDLVNVPAGLIVQNDKATFQELNEVELLNFKLTGAAHFENRVQKIVSQHRSPTKFCVMALFMDHAPQIKTNCKYQIVLDSLQSQVLSLGADQFVITGPLDYVVRCGLREQRLTCESQCVVNLDSGCSLKTSEDMIFATYGNGSGATQSYSVAASYLAEFFDNDDADVLKGDTLFSFPPDIQIPELQVYRAAARDFVSQDESIALNMRKVVQQIKNSDIVVHSLADSIVMSQQTADNSQSWNSTFGWTLIGVLAVIGLLIFQLVLVTLRLRVVSLSVAVLQHSLKAEAQILDGSSDPGKLRFAYQPTSTSSVPVHDVGDPRDIHVMIVDSIQGFWVYLVLSIVGLVLLAVIVRHLFKRYCREFRQFRVKTHLGLHFSGVGQNSRNIIIKIQEVPALASDIVVVQNDVLSNFEIRSSACIFKKLTFVWPAEVLDNFTAQKHVVRQSVSLKLYQAYLVNHVLSSRFNCKPVLLEGSKIVKVKLRVGQVSRPTTPNSPQRKMFQPIASAPLDDDTIEMADVQNYV